MQIQLSIKANRKPINMHKILRRDATLLKSCLSKNSLRYFLKDDFAKAVNLDPINLPLKELRQISDALLYHYSKRSVKGLTQSLAELMSEKHIRV